MQLLYTPTFKKQYRKLPKLFQQQFDNRLKLFLLDPTHPTLRIHPLIGKYHDYWSMNVNGDLRALYSKKSQQIIIFALIGTHSQLYG